MTGDTIASKSDDVDEGDGGALAVKGNTKKEKVHLGDRRYLEFHKLTRLEVIAAFQNAKILPS
jgi:hypothetical protein